MSALSDKIAAEHHCAPWPDTVRGPIPYHLCAAGCEGVILEDQGDVRRHVADVTERAVRESIAQQVTDAQSSVFYPAHPHPEAPNGAGFTSGVAEGIDFAARIAREGTTP